MSQNELLQYALSGAFDAWRQAKSRYTHTPSGYNEYLLQKASDAVDAIREMMDEDEP